VIGVDPGAISRTVILNRGQDQGVEEGMAVISIQGVVGKIFQVDGGRSRVLLINDINSRVDAVVQRSRARAIAAGTLSGELMLKFLARRQNLEVGDVLISSGMDGVFPSGVVVGSVESLDKNPNLVLEEARLRPAVDFDSIEEVFIVQQRAEH
jgi:rod shape-determining protein MreC